MPDISMCQSKSCPSREKCYRHEAEPDMLQTYANFDEIRGDADKCDRFWPLRTTKEADNG